MSPSPPESQLPAPKRWWIYQRERFPLLAHGLLIAAMSLGALGYAAALAGERPAAVTLLLCWLGLLAFFFLLRVADEFKDYATDCRHRPYRAVPRGLISLRELGWAAGLAVALQVLLALPQGLWLMAALALAWLWLILMSREFFVSQWLQARQLIYLFSHMAIMPLLMLYALAHQWLVLGHWQAEAAAVLLPLALGSGLCFELGRKIRRPSAEEPGVETYSALWGGRTAALAWLAAVAFSLASLLAAGLLAGQGLIAASLAGLLLTAALLAVAHYCRHPESQAAPAIEALSAVVALLAYSLLGGLAWL